MKIPALFYGHPGPVRAKCIKVGRRLLAGESLEEIFSQVEILDTDDVPVETDISYNGFIELDHIPSPHKAFRPKELANGIWDTYYDVRDNWQEEELKKHMEAIFASILQFDWAVLSLLPRQENYSWFTQVRRNGEERTEYNYYHRFIPFFESIQNHWESLLSAGNRYEHRRPLYEMLGQTILRQFGVIQQAEKAVQSAKKASWAGGSRQ